MAYFKLFTGLASAVLMSSSAFAQVTVVNEAAPIADSNIVRAQFIKPGDVSPEEYQALLDEADRIRAFQSHNSSYTGISSSSVEATGSQIVTDSYGYEIELFAPSEVPAATTVVEPVTTYSTTNIAAPTITYDTAPVASAQTIAPAPVSSNGTHYVSKGDTLYSLARHHGVSVTDIRSANGMSDNNLQLGQTLIIPGAAQQSAAIIQPAPQPSANVIRTVQPIAGSNNYAVLPKETLYGISRRACVSVSAIKQLNGIADPSAIQAGQRLTLPANHCLK